MLRLAASRTTTTAVVAHARASCGSIGVTSSSASFSTSTPARNDEGDVVSKLDLIKSVAEEHGLNNSQANRIVSGLFDSITEVSVWFAPWCMCVGGAVLFVSLFVLARDVLGILFCNGGFI